MLSPPESSTALVHSETLPEEADQHRRLLQNQYSVDGPVRRVAKMTPALKRKFCEALANGASPTKAAKAIEIARSTAYYQRSIDPEFWEAWQEALERAADLHEDALNELSMKTRNVGAVIFQLKNRRPDKWKDRHEVEQHRETRYVHELDPSAARAIAQNILAQLQQQEPPVSLPAVVEPVSVEEARDK